MVVIENPNQYYFVKFQKSSKKNAKYDAILEHKETGRIRVVPFGGIKPDGTPYEQYRDITGLKLYSKYDHNDLRRRHNYLARHAKTKDNKYSSSWFSAKYLW